MQLFGSCCLCLRLSFSNVVFGMEDIVFEVVLMKSSRLSFCIDLRVDSVPRKSLTIVEPKY